MFNIGDIVEIHPDGIHSCTKGTVVETGCLLLLRFGNGPANTVWYPDKNLSLYLPPDEAVLCANDSKYVTVIWPDGSLCRGRSQRKGGRQWHSPRVIKLLSGPMSDGGTA